VTILTGIGYAIGAQTAELSYAELVHQGLATVRQYLHWIAPVAVLGFVGYVWISRRIMARSETR
jgi:hypothetical protein